MIQLPIWAAVLLVGLLPVVGLAGYAYGWKWCEASLKKIYGVKFERHYSGPMTPEQKLHFDEAFKHMGRAFGEMDEVFKKGRR